jgi:hypothetical protein
VQAGRAVERSGKRTETRGLPPASRSWRVIDRHQGQPNVRFSPIDALAIPLLDDAGAAVGEFIFVEVRGTARSEG